MSEKKQDIMEAANYTYSSFISYRHKPEDIAAAKAVQRALETFRIPKDIQKKTGVRKLKRCFRDQDELPLADDLGSSIEKALRESEWLIVICSPELPQSKWCCREVDYFICLGRKDRIIPVLVSGEPADSYPPQITRADTEQGPEEVEPLAADLRGNLKKQLKTEKLRLVARMLNLDFNDLKKRERERALRRGLVVVSCVLAAALGFAGYAIHKNRLLTEERNATARNATELLIEKSVRSTAEGEFGRGLAYALQAFDGSRIFENEYDDAVSAALEAAMYPELYSQIGSLKDNGALHRWAALSNDGRLIACRQADNSLQVYSSVTGERLFVIRNFGGYWKFGRDFSPDGKYVCQLFENTVTLYSSTDGTQILHRTLPEGWKTFVSSLTVNNQVAVYPTDGGDAALYDPFEDKLTVLEGVSMKGNGRDTVQIHRSGLRGAWCNGSQIWLVDTQSGKVLRTMEGSMYMSLGGYTEDENYFQFRDGTEHVYLHWDTLEEACRSEHWGTLSPDGTMIASTGKTDGFTLWDAATGEELWTAGYNKDNEIYTVAFSDSDTLIASHMDLQIYRLSDRSVVYDSGGDRTTYGFDFAAGRLVMALRSGGCLVNLMPEEEDILPHLTVETRENFSEEDLAGITAWYPLAGTWNGSTYYIQAGDDWITLEMDEPGLVYLHDNQEYILHPVNGVMNPFIYVSPDGQWQALIRGEEVDIFRAAEGTEPVMTIPGNGYTRLCAAFWGDTLALGSYVENLVLYDLITGDCLGTVKTGAMCTEIQFSPDGKHIIGLSAMAAHASVANTENLAVIMRIPITDIYADLTVGFNQDGSEAAVLYPDGHADVGLLYQDLGTLIEKARKYTE